MDDWDTVTKIGSRTRGAGGVEREKVVKGKSALNSAMRSGAVIATEKKYTVGNPVTKSTGVEGQRLTKVDRSDEIIKPKTVSREVGSLISKTRNEQKLNQKALGDKCKPAISAKIIADIEKGDAVYNDQHINAIENALNIRLRGENLGEPKRKPKGKDVAKAPAPKK